MRCAALLAVLPLAAAAAAQEQRRPCGPGSGHSPLRIFYPQGFLGADFRPVCRAHDACYDAPGADKATCDRTFYEGMLTACENSAHPRMCRAAAHLAYQAVQGPGGEKAFRRSQGVSP